MNVNFEYNVSVRLFLLGMDSSIFQAWTLETHFRSASQDYLGVPSTLLLHLFLFLAAINLIGAFLVGIATSPNFPKKFAPFFVSWFRITSAIVSVDAYLLMMNSKQVHNCFYFTFALFCSDNSLSPHRCLQPLTA